MEKGMQEIFLHSFLNAAASNMFILVLIEDIVRIPPQDFKNEGEAIHREINQKFANKVINNVGLCLELHDVLEISQGTVYAGDGAAFATVKFRMIVFKPFVGEVLVGSIKSMNEHGIQVTFGFFDQIRIPAGGMKQPSIWDSQLHAWSWLWPAPDGTNNTLSMKVGGKIRFRVEQINFSPPESKRVFAELETPPAKPVASEEPSNTSKPNPNDSSKSQITSQANRPKSISTNAMELDKALPKLRSSFDVYMELEKSTGGLTGSDLAGQKDIQAAEFKGRPMVIVGNTAEPGLGMVEWWANQSPFSQQSHPNESQQYEKERPSSSSQVPHDQHMEVDGNLENPAEFEDSHEEHHIEEEGIVDNEPVNDVDSDGEIKEGAEDE